MQPSQTEAPYQAGGRETVAAGPRASVNGTSCPWSSGLEPGSRSQYGQRWPELPRPPGHRCPSAHPAGRSTLGSWVSPEPPQGRCRTRGAGRGRGRSGSRRVAVARGRSPAGPAAASTAAAAAAAVPFWARLPHRSLAPRLRHPQTGGQRARRCCLSALP